MKKKLEESTTQALNPTLESLLKSAIPVSKANFHSAVNNTDQVPENSFSIESAAPSRRVAMWWTPHTLICLHKNKYFGVPISNVIFANFTTEENLK